MEFGIYSALADPPRGERMDLRMDEVIEEAQAAEEAGFDSCFFGEHHQDKDGFFPSPLIVATAVASRTQRLRVGTSVILLPLYHPVHVAEDVATLDIVSKGRVILGVGMGYQPADFNAFGVQMRDRVGLFEESVEIIQRCWTGEPFSFHGKHYQLDDIRITPLPFQRPAPPLWIGAGALPGARRAGRMSDGFVAGSIAGIDATERLARSYGEAAAEAGRKHELVLLRDAWVAPTRGEAETVYGPEVVTAFKYYWRNGVPELRRLGSEDNLTLDTVAQDRLIIGDPEECVSEFRRWSEVTGAQYFLLRLRHAHSGGPPHAKIMDAIRLFGERVIPYCR